eukprot:gene2111-biopygen1889
MSSDSDNTASSLSEVIDSTDESSGTENTAVRCIFEPYMDEPLARVVQPNLGHDVNRSQELSLEDADKDGLTPLMLEARFLKVDPVTSWCTCTKCKDDSLVGSREFRCCREVAEAHGKVVFDGLDHKCVTLHPGFDAMTDRIVLKQVGPLLKDRQGRRYGRRTGQTENE